MTEESLWFIAENGEPISVFSDRERAQEERFYLKEENPLEKYKIYDIPIDELSEYPKNWNWLFRKISSKSIRMITKILNTWKKPEESNRFLLPKNKKKGQPAADGRMRPRARYYYRFSEFLPGGGLRAVACPLPSAGGHTQPDRMAAVAKRRNERIFIFSTRKAPLFPLLFQIVPIFRNIFNLYNKKTNIFFPTINFHTKLRKITHVQLYEPGLRFPDLTNII